jgi:hypothetical protein
MWSFTLKEQRIGISPILDNASNPNNTMESKK